MEQYFTKTPESERIDRKFAVVLNGRDFIFTASSSVFSKDHLDTGTELLIKALGADVNGAKGRFLDLGCGYGPIGIFLAAANPASTILMADINERVAELAEGNAASNHIKNASAVRSDGFEAVEGLFDVIATNPPIRTGKQNVARLMRDSFGHMTSGAKFYAVIGKKQGAESYARIIADIFGNCEIISKKSGFYVFRAIKC
jgi:16S rRNA (guanine1207-N2)-methyltransferase